MSVERFSARQERLARSYSERISAYWHDASHPLQGVEKSMKARSFLQTTMSNFVMIIDEGMDSIPAETYDRLFTGLYHMNGDIVPPPQNIRDN